MANPDFRSPHRDFDIGRAQNITEQDATDIQSLFEQLNPETATDASGLVGMLEYPFIVARTREDRRIVGLMEVSRSDTHFDIWNLVVDLEERRKGVGESIVRFCVAEAEERGAQQIYATMQGFDLEPAQRVLSRIGFNIREDISIPMMKLDLNDA